MTVGPLSLWPSSRARESLAPSQRAALYAKIAAALADTLSLPPPKRDTLQSRSFVASYARDVALNALDALLWPDKRESRISTTEAAIRARALSLAEKLANSTSITLDVETLIDLSVAFAGSKRLRSVWTAAHASDQSLRNQIQDALVPSFVALFQPAQVTSSGLSGIRKSAHILLCLLRVLPAPLLSFFANSTSMALSVARAYDAGLGSIAVNYGGPPDPARISVLDDDQKLWLQTKVSLIDSFHILLRAHIERLANASAGSSELTIAADAAFEVIFALIEEEGGPEVLSTPQAGIPFATRGLLVDYQHVYPLSHTLQRALTKAAANDPRMDILDASLRNFDAGDRSDSGALRLLLRSSGHGPTSMITQPPPLIASSSAAANSIPEDAELEAQVAQVLDVLPDVDPSHVRALLCAPDQPFNRNTERTLESLLDGSAPSLAELQSRQDHKDKWVFTANRANIHDGEAINMSQMRKGKRIDDADNMLRDRAEADALKADILARVDAMNAAEELWEEENRGESAPRDLAYEDELDEGVRVVGDGEADDSDSEDGDATVHQSDAATTEKLRPETILELAYIDNPNVFDRDATTRRSNARTTLRSETGWADEQIEGWRVMLERNPNKDKILQKHEFAGNKQLTVNNTDDESSRASTPAGRNRGRGQGRGRGGGGGSRGRGGGSGGKEARDRAMKERRGNSNRKRGHDKKMVRAGASAPSS